MTEALRAKVAEAAAANGRSLSEEVEFHIYEIFRAAELRAVIREEVDAALKAERARNGAQPHTLDVTDSGPLRLELHPQWRDYLPS